MNQTTVKSLDEASQILRSYIAKLKPVVDAGNAKQFYDHRFLSVDYYDNEGRSQHRLVATNPSMKTSGSEIVPNIIEFQELWIRYNEICTISSIVDWLLAINRDMDIILHYGKSDQDIVYVLLNAINKKWGDEYIDMAKTLSKVTQASSWLHTLSRSFALMRPASVSNELLEAFRSDGTHCRFNSCDSARSNDELIKVLVVDENMNKFVDKLRKFVSRIYSVLKYKGFPSAGYIELCSVDYYGTRLLDAIGYVNFQSFDEYIQYIITGPFSIDGQFIITWFDESNYDLGDFYEFN